MSPWRMAARASLAGDRTGGGRPSRSRPFSKPQAGMPPGSEEDDALDDALAGPPVDAPASAGVVGKRGDGGRRWMPIAAHSPS